MVTPHRQNPRRTNGHRRTQLRRRVLAEGGPCALCHHPVDTTLKTPHPMSPEVDEIIPVSRGGSPYERSNVQLTHRICNQRKSNKIVGEDAQAGNSASKPVRTSQNW